MSVKTRLSPKEKLRIFTESLKDNVKISEIPRREEIWPREYYRIKEKALSGALEALKNSRKVTALRMLTDRGCDLFIR